MVWKLTLGQITVVQNLAVTVAVTSVIHYYFRLYQDMKEHKPMGKLISFKLIVGVNFIQTVSSTHTIHQTFVAFGLPNHLCSLPSAS